MSVEHKTIVDGLTPELGVHNIANPLKDLGIYAVAFGVGILAYETARAVGLVRKAIIDSLDFDQSIGEQHGTAFQGTTGLQGSDTV